MDVRLKGATPVCTKNSIRVDDVMESPFGTHTFSTASNSSKQPMRLIAIPVKLLLLAFFGRPPVGSMRDSKNRSVLPRSLIEPEAEQAASFGFVR
jgi:hypothetical protein